MNAALLFLILPGPAPFHAAQMDPQAAVDHIDAWMAVSNAAVQLPLENRANPGQVTPALLELEEQAAKAPRWPEHDPVADAVLEMLAGMRRLSVEVYPALDALMVEMAPRATHLEQATAAFQELNAVRYGQANAVRQAMHDFGVSQGVDMGELVLLELPPPTGAELPGGPSVLPESYRQNFAQRHVGEVRGACNAGVDVMNEALGAASSPEQDLAPIGQSMDLALARVAEIPGWAGDASLREACAGVLQTQQGMLQQEIPALRALFEGGDLDAFNTQSRALTGALWDLQVDLYAQEATFRQAWGLEVDPPPIADASGEDAALAALARQRFWSLLVNQSVLLSTRLSIALLLDQEQYDVAVAGFQEELRQMQAQAESPPPFDGEDTLRGPAIAVLDVLEQSFGDWGPRSAELLRVPHPRAAHQEALIALGEEEKQALAQVLGDYSAAHQTFSEAHGIQVITGRTILSMPRPTLEVTLPGPAVDLPVPVRIAFASSHHAEVDQVFGAALSIWNGLIGGDPARWPEEIPAARAAIAQSLSVVQGIPPWMGEDTLVAAAQSAMEIWLRHLDVTLPRMLVFAEDLSSERSVNQYNKNLDTLNETSAASVDAWNTANEVWAQDWQYDALGAHNEAMSEWAEASRTLLEEE